MKNQDRQRTVNARLLKENLALRQRIYELEAFARGVVELFAGPAQKKALKKIVTKKLQ